MLQQQVTKNGVPTNGSTQHDLISTCSELSGINFYLPKIGIGIQLLSDQRTATIVREIKCLVRSQSYKRSGNKNYDCAVIQLRLWINQLRLWMIQLRLWINQLRLWKNLITTLQSFYRQFYSQFDTSVPIKHFEDCPNNFLAYLGEKKM